MNFRIVPLRPIKSWGVAAYLIVKYPPPGEKSTKHVNGEGKSVVQKGAQATRIITALIGLHNKTHSIVCGRFTRQ